MRYQIATVSVGGCEVFRAVVRSDRTAESVAGAVVAGIERVQQASPLLAQGSLRLVFDVKIEAAE